MSLHWYRYLEVAAPRGSSAAAQTAQDFRLSSPSERRGWLPGLRRRLFSAGPRSHSSLVGWRGLADSSSLSPRGLDAISGDRDVLAVVARSRALDALTRTNAAVLAGQHVAGRSRSQGGLRPH